MKKNTIYLIIILLFISLFFLNVNKIDAKQNINDRIREQLILFKEYETKDNQIKPPYFLDELKSIYSKNNFEPFWFEDTEMKKSAYNLINFIDDIEYEGLNPKQYRYKFLLGYFIKKDLSNREIAVADIFMTNSYFLIASHFTNGLIDQKTFTKKWKNITSKIDMYEFLTAAIKKDIIVDKLYSLLPQSENYLLLKNKLKEFLEIKKKGGLIKFTGERMIAKGMKGNDVLNLKKRLKQTGYFNGELNKEFDYNLKKAVINFQKAHGLISDGVVGDKTKKALNIDIDHKIKTITVNMERLRWLPQSLGKTYILVNIADFKLKVIERDKKVFDMKVIVGKEQRSTPVFSNKISYVVLNPFWNVPKKLAVEDKLPLIKEDLKYLEKYNYEVLKIVNGEFVKANPEKINWAELNKVNFNYFLRQKPGNSNSLGKIKFMFPNEYSVYLHDTPSKDLFLADQRDFSSGCIRLQKPFKLARYIFYKDNKLDQINIKEILETQKEEIIYLDNKIPIHIVYMTAWVDNNFKIQFRDDIYKRDQKLIDIYFELKEIKNK